VGGLLLFRKIDLEQLPAEILQAVPIRIGPHQFRSDLRTPDGGADGLKMPAHHGDVETAEMEKLQDGAIRKERPQRRSGIVRTPAIAGSRELDEMRVADAA